MMTVEPITGHDRPGSEPSNLSPQPQADARLAARATAAIVRLLEGIGAVAVEIKGMLRARVQIPELTRRGTQAEHIDHAKWVASLDEAIDALFRMSLPAVGYPVPLGGAGVGEYGVELE